MMPSESWLSTARKEFLATLLADVLRVGGRGVPSNADTGNSASIKIALGILTKIGEGTAGERLPGQTSGNKFEDICARFLQAALRKLAHLRPGDWKIVRQGDGSGLPVAITSYEQYAHLKEFAKAAERHPELAVALRSHYDLRPDIIVARIPEPDSRINAIEHIVDESGANRASLRALNNTRPILHASVSCKWTLRSDRAQNARTEALNLFRDRKGRAPHIVVVTGEPLPSRIASLAFGTGDIDCLYHFALKELLETLSELNDAAAQQTAGIMIEGKRLKDISDLPLDLVI